MGEINTVIYLIASPFGTRDYDRFGVETFLKSGFDVQIWDMTDYFVPEYRACAQEAQDPLEFSGVHEFSGLDDIIEAIGSLKPEVYFFDFMGLDLKSYPILVALSGSRMPYANFKINSVPDFGGEGTSGSLTDRLQILTASLKRRVKTLNRERIRHYAFKLSPFGKSNLEPPDLLVVDGKKFYRAAIKSKAPQTSIVKAHSLDYDLFLKYRDQEKSITEPTAVFLDEYFPFHPDHVYLKVAPCVTADVYYPQLRRFFDHLETSLGLRVKVAAHPRSCYDNPKDYFGDREVIRGRTIELVRDAELVLLSCSTAVNFAVLFQKPMLFITTDQINRNYEKIIKTMSTYLGAPLLNLDDSISVDREDITRFSADNYDTYKNEFIKMADSPDLYFWEIVRDALSENSIHNREATSIAC